VYSGETGATASRRSGGGGNYICMPKDPEYSEYRGGIQGHSLVYVAEYEFPVERNKDHYDGSMCCLPLC